MMNYYPLKAIVTTNQVLAAQYESNPYSAFLTSGCLSPSQLTELLNQGASFDALLFVNGEGQDILARLEGHKPNNPIEAMKLEAVSIDPSDTQGAVKHLHELLNGPLSLFDIGG